MPPGGPPRRPAELSLEPYGFRCLRAVSEADAATPIEFGALAAYC